MSLKSDMIVEELKRVTTERDDFKKQADQAQKSTKEAWDEVAGLKKKTEVKEEKEDTSEEFFSFDNEVPRLEGELKEKQEKIDNLTSEVEKLKRDLSVTRESTEGMVQNLETATRELVELRDTKDKLEGEMESLKTTHGTEVEEWRTLFEKTSGEIKAATPTINQMKEELMAKNEEVAKLRAQLDEAEKQGSGSQSTSEMEAIIKEKEASEKKITVIQNLADNLRTQLKEAESSLTELKSEISKKTESSNQLQKIVNFVDAGLNDNNAWTSAKESISAGRAADFDEIRKSIIPVAVTEIESSNVGGPDEDVQSNAGAGNGATATGGSKKKNKKKKKGGKAAEEPAKPTETTSTEKPVKEEPVADSVSRAEVQVLKEKITSLTQQLSDKESAIDRLSAKLKGEEDLKEEIESLRDDLVNVGQEHVEAKDKIKVLSAEKSALEESIGKLEKELVELRTSNASNTA